MTGTVLLPKLGSAAAVTAQALDATGQPLGPPRERQRTDDGWQLPLGDPPTTWYLATVRR